ncbi:MAG: hypothetical protein K6F92_02500 [Lachnospiraceae bacterium]|nr:hypothetical protein [Lachnospiraceae bacterium]
MDRILRFVKKEAMLVVAIIAAVVSMFITPPDVALIGKIDWRTLATLFMLLSVLDGFKSENLFLPVIKFTDRIGTQIGLSFFLVYGVFFTSMFVTNDVSLIIFVPLTIMLFRGRKTEKYILPILAMENIAAIRGSLLTPFGSPQNLFLYSNSGIDFGSFILMMLPLCAGSFLLIAIFILFIYRDILGRDRAVITSTTDVWEKDRRVKRIVYLVLFAVVIASIITRTQFWPYITAFVVVTLLIFDRNVFRRVDYALLGTFLCFFVFSSSLASNTAIAAFLSETVAGHEYIWSIGISQIISNVPASIVLWPFTTNLKALIYGLDSAGLVTVIGSLASVINLRIYTREYPGRGRDFMIVFEKVSLAFFIIVVFLQLLLL